MQIFFDGLIAFVPEGNDPKNPDRVWALLVDAKWKAPKKFKALKPELPPLAYEEIEQLGLADAQAIKLAQDWFPSHETRLRFRNAKVTSGNFSNDGNGKEAGEEIEGKEVAFGVGSQGSLSFLGVDNFGQLQKIVDARGTVAAKYADEIPKDMLHPDWKSVRSRYPQISARVRIDAMLLGGAKISANTLGCQGSQRWFGFTTKNETACGSADDHKSNVLLAEDVVLSLSGVQQSLDVELNGEKISVEPAVPGETLTVEVLNVMSHHATHPDKAFMNAPNNRACGGTPHHLAYRWFYRLRDPAFQSDRTLLYTPCEVVVGPVPASGRKCPQPIMFGK